MGVFETIGKVGEESDSSGSERSPKQAKRRNRGGPPTTRRRKSGISARERNLRRLESNERERMRMHSLNDAFEVILSRVAKYSSFVTFPATRFDSARDNFDKHKVLKNVRKFNAVKVDQVTARCRNLNSQ